MPKSLDAIKKNPGGTNKQTSRRLIKPPVIKKRSRSRQFLKHNKKLLWWSGTVAIIAIILGLIGYFLIMPIRDLAKLPQTGTYLVLFQNNAELRGGGGFLGSFAVINLQGKHIKKYYFESNIYKKDNAFTRDNKIPLPDYFYPYLSKDITLAMRDANYPADFAAAAQLVGHYYTLEYGSKVDGVIAINATAIEDMLGVTGPIALANQNKTISQDTFFDTIQREIQVNYFQSEINKQINEPKTILKDMIDPLMQRFNAISPISLYRYLTKELHQKQILFWFSDNRQQLVLDRNWGGTINPWDGESIFVSNTNINGQKSSLVTSEAISLQGADQKQPGRTLTITRSHHSGNYYQANSLNRDYIRIYLPLGTQLQTITRDNQLLPASDYNVSEEFNRTVIGVWAITDINQVTTITLQYQLPVSSLHGKILYQKQPGVEQEKVNVQFKGKTIFNQPVDSDTII